MRLTAATGMRIDSILLSPGRFDVVMISPSSKAPGADYESLTAVARDSWPLLPRWMTVDTLLFHIWYTAGSPGTLERSSFFFYRALVQEPVR